MMWVRIGNTFDQFRAFIQTQAKVMMVLDGDQGEVEAIFRMDVDSLSANDRTEIELRLKELGVSVVGTGKDEDLTKWMRWCRQRVFLIDQVCPEQILLEILCPHHALLTDSLPATNKKFKAAVRSSLKSTQNDCSTNAQLVIFNLKLGEASTGTRVNAYLDALAKKIAEGLAQFAELTAIAF